MAFKVHPPLRQLGAWCCHLCTVIANVLVLYLLFIPKLLPYDVVAAQVSEATYRAAGDCGERREAVFCCSRISGEVYVMSAIF